MAKTFLDHARETGQLGKSAFEIVWARMDALVVGGGGGTLTTSNATLTGARDGVNRDFTVAAAFVSGSTRLYLNGARQRLGAADDYIEFNSTTIRFAVAPRAGDNIVLDYDRPAA